MDPAAPEEIEIATREYSLSQDSIRVEVEDTKQFQLINDNEVNSRRASFQLGILCFLELLLKFAIPTCTCYLIQQIYSKPPFLFSSLFWFFVFFHLCVSCIYFILSFRMIKEEAKNFSLFKVAFHLCEGLISLGVYLYLEKSLQRSQIPLFFIPVLFLLATMCLRSKALILLSILFSLNIVQQFIIVLFPETQLLFLLFPIYLLEAKMEAVLALVIIGLLIVFVIKIVAEIIWQRNNICDKLFSVLGCVALAFPFIWTGLMDNLMLVEFGRLLHNRQITPEGTLHSDPNFLHLCSVYFLLGTITTGILLLGFGSFMLVYSNTINKIGNHYMRLEKFRKEIDLGIMKEETDNFFKKVIPSSQSQKKILLELNDSNDVCFICYSAKNVVYFKPCRHTGMCEPCFMQYLTRSKVCPICKGLIQKGYIFAFDKTTKAFISKQRIIIN